MTVPSDPPPTKEPSEETPEPVTVRRTAGPPDGEHTGRATLGKYRLLKKVGSGGMGAVFQAEDQELKRIVAVKILPRDKAKNPILVKRFKAEAQAAANLSHDNIVTVYEAGEAEGYLYIALEYVEGTDVQELVTKHGVPPVKRTLDIIRQVARALEHTASQGLVHRDIKPSNLLIRPDGVVKLTDLGLARFIDETVETSITRAGYTVGTVDYMAPEQARSSKAADVRSDIYSLGCTWYFMLTGQPPFPAGSVTNKITAHALDPVPDPRLLNRNVPEAVVVVLRRMLAKTQEERYQSPRELLADLKTAVQARDTIADNVRDALRDDDAFPGRSRRSSRNPAGPSTRSAARGRRAERKAAKANGGPPSSEARIQIQIDPLRFVVAALLLVGVLGGVWWISHALSSVANPENPEQQRAVDPESRPSAPIVKPTP